MTILMDHQIQKLVEVDKAIGVSPWDPTMLNPASLDLTLGNKLKIAKYGLWDRHGTRTRISPWRTDPELFWDDFDMANPRQGSGHSVWLTYQESGVLGGQLVPGYLLRPGELVLGVTAEKITVPDSMAARVEGKSTIGRWGLFVHVTAGFVDPGWSGRITLELYNASPYLIILEPGRRISQICFMSGNTRARTPYHGKYQGDEEPSGGRPDADTLTKETVADN